MSLLLHPNIPALRAAEGDRSQARSMVLSQHGIVASEHPLASQAAAAILAQGGSAVDAAITANAAMGVFSPMMCGIGGDLFALVYEAKSDRLYGLNASGWSAQNASPDWIRSRDLDSIPFRGIEPVTVPGAVDGWDKLHRRFGRLPFHELLAPAIQFAEEGFPVPELVAAYWSGHESLLEQDEQARRVFLIEGRVPAVGEMFRNPDLAWSYRQLANHGPRALYEGPIAERILATSHRLKGVLSAADLSEFSSEWVEPISTTYRDWTVYEIPPNGQGIAALMMLNLMEHHPIADLGHNSTATLHAMIEAKKIAYADMQRFVTDPRFIATPVEEMLSKGYARHRASLIDPDRANCTVAHGEPLPPGSETTYLSVVDAEGNMVSLIQSVYYLFGSGVVPEGAGFILQNRGAMFSLDPGHPNVLAGRKRTLHTIIPGFMEKGETRIAFGIMGGWNQSQAHAQFVANVVDHGMNIQSALEAARFTKASFDGCDVQIEQRIPESVRDQLTSKGHEIEVLADFSQAMGGGQAVLRDFSTGLNQGASDPRKDGAAIPEFRPHNQPK
jgi:gamma-glutamyltranspeptidase/glutathione hydrolase